MQAINRQIVILKPQRPFIEWHRSLPDPQPLDLKIEDMQEDCAAYLIPVFDTEDESIEFVYLNFAFLFEEELYGWYTDESTWPKITLDNFKKWFDIEIHSMILDLMDDEIEKEDL